MFKKPDFFTQKVIRVHSVLKYPFSRMIHLHNSCLRYHQYGVFWPFDRKSWQEGRLPLHYAATRDELKPIYDALVSKGGCHHNKLVRGVGGGGSSLVILVGLITLTHDHHHVTNALIHRWRGKGWSDLSQLPSWSIDHLIYWPPDHLINWPPDQLTTWSIDHLIN